MKTFLGDKKVKAKYVARVKAHVRADEIVKGYYWENGKGCAVGCTIEGSDHQKYETELGIPKEVAYLEDTIFENLPNGEAKAFPLQFLQAVGVGKDLSKIAAQVVIWQFEDKKHGLKNIQEVKDDKEVYGFCEEVVALYKRDLAGDKPTEKEFYDLFLKIDGAGAWAGAGAGAGAWAGAGARVGAWAWAGARVGAGAGARAWAWAGVGAEFDERILALRDYFLQCIKEAPNADI